MSVKIGLVAEGVSDYYALRYITERYLKEEDAYVIPLKPKMTRQGRQDGFGGWQGVFDYISGNEGQDLIIEAIKEGCQFVIIQIDTDVCEQYGVVKDDNVKILWNNVAEKIRTNIHPNFDRSLIIYAICIHELECWLIPFVCSDKQKCENTEQCLNRLNREIRTQGSIDKNNKNSDRARRLYEAILNKKKKVREIKDCSQFNYGFQSFVTQLEKIKSQSTQSREE